MTMDLRNPRDLWASLKFPREGFFLASVAHGQLIARSRRRRTRHVGVPRQPVHLLLQGLQAIDLPFPRPVAPPFRHGGYRPEVLPEGSHKAFERIDSPFLRILQPVMQGCHLTSAGDATKPE